MSGILEALDAMYEVKGEAEASSRWNRIKDSKHYSDKGNKRSEAKDGHYKSTYMSGNKFYKSDMRNADDYRDRVRSVEKRNAYDRAAENRRDLHRERNIPQRQYNSYKDFSSKNECTETIDTLEGIL